MKMDSPKILMLNNLQSTFVKNDYDILSSNFQVDVLSGNSVLDYLKQIHKAKGYDLYFSWWGTSLHTALFAKMFKGKSIIVAGGGDATEIPEISYGSFTTWKKHIVKFVFENADIVLAVSERTKCDLLRHSKPRSIEVVYNGVDTEKYKPKGNKENIVLMLAGGRTLNSQIVKRKGIETFVKCAKHLPAIQFVLVAKHKNDTCFKHLKDITPSNVKITGFIPFEKLLNYYQRAKVYVQISFYESFGVSVAEAMLCQCIPVVTNRGAIPEVVGDNGFYVPYGNPEITSKAIKKALDSSNEIGKKARQRIKQKFTLKKRENKLTEIINRCMKGKTEQ